GSPVDHATDDRLEVARPARRLHLHGADLLPVVVRVDAVARAAAVAVGQHLVALDAAPVLDGVAPGGGDLEEVRAVALVKAERGLREGRRRAVHLGKVPPEGVRGSVGRSALDGGLETLELGHDSPRSPPRARTTRARVTAGRPSAFSTWKRSAGPSVVS